MSEENVRTVEAAFRALASKGIDGMSEYWADDIDYRAIEGAPDDRGPLSGKDAVRGYIVDWADTFDDFRNEVVELIDAGGEKVIAGIRVSGRAKLSGVATELTYVAVYSLRDGRIARVREYATRPEALKAAGIQE